jgi:hypothetical protein
VSALGADFQKLHQCLTSAQAEHPADPHIREALGIVDRYLDGALNGYADPAGVGQP